MVGLAEKDRQEKLSGKDIDFEVKQTWVSTWVSWHCQDYIHSYILHSKICFCIYKMGKIVVSPLQIRGKD